MKKSLLLASLMSATLFANAQVSFGPKISLGLANQRVKDNDKTVDTKGVFSPAIGVALNAKISDNFAIQPALQYAMVGSRTETSFPVIGTIKTKTTLNYIQLPVQLNIQFPLGDAAAIGLGVGPYLGYTFGGKSKFEAAGESETTNIKAKADVKAADLNGDDDFVAPLDYGVVIAPFVEFGAFQVGATVNLGLADLNPKFEGKKDDKSSAKNIYYGVTAAYFFGKK